VGEVQVEAVLDQDQDQAKGEQPETFETFGAQIAERVAIWQRIAEDRRGTLDNVPVTTVANLNTYVPIVRSQRKPRAQTW
jgi:hypothetical protein